jgi:cytochrome c oxidase subunit IV
MSVHVEIVPQKTYWKTFAALMFLLVATVGAAYIDLGILNLPLALLIAAIKAIIILAFFMHLLHASRVLWLFAGAGLVWFLIMIALTFGDYLTRGMIPGER